MAIFYTSQKSKAKKKPGWQKAQQEYDAWLKGIQSMTLFDNAKPKKAAVKKINPIVDTSSPTLSDGRKKAFELPSKQASILGGGIKYQDPKVQYKENPEMLERELRARERKFTTAPLYNKAGDQYVSDDMMKDILSGSNRRR